MRVVFLGSGAIGVPSLEAVAARHEIVAVVTQPDRPSGRSLRPSPSPIKLAARALGLLTFEPVRIRDMQKELAAFRADLFLVIAYGQILPKAVLDLPGMGCINVHASLLPRHRGASPVHAAILAGDACTGVTTMWMNEGLDTGDLLARVECPIGPEETAGELHDKLAGLAPAVLCSSLDLIAEGMAPRIPQDPSQATLCGKLRRADGALDWSLPSEELARRVRGLAPWPGAFTTLPNGSLLKVHRAVAECVEGAIPGLLMPGDGLLVGCGSGALRLIEVQSPGTRRMGAEEFLRGHPLPSHLPDGDSPSQPHAIRIH
jgi:methionyl-tRNA formyltransferase